MPVKHQGKNSSQLFSGRGLSKASKTVYGENEALYVKIIRKEFSPKETIRLVDLGSFKGEFISRIFQDLPHYTFEVVAVDVSKPALNTNSVAKRKVCKNLANTALPDRYASLTILRYALAWNTLKEQERILKETKRITNNLLIISHQGPLEKEAAQWRIQWGQLFSGVAVTKLKREGYYFSSAHEIELLMNKLHFNYKRIEQKTVKNILDLFVEKYALSKTEIEKASHLVAGVNNIQITTWIINF